MAIDRLLRANRTVLLVPMVDLATGPALVSATGTTCPFEAPTSAVLDSWRAIVTTSATGAQHGGNISCALLDDLTLGLADSDTDSELTICSIGNEADPTFYNVDAALTGLRDRSKSDTGVFNLFTQLVNGVDARYAIIDRIGYPSTTAFASGQNITGEFEARTDFPLDQKEDRGNLKIQQNPKPSGNVLVNYTLAS